MTKPIFSRLANLLVRDLMKENWTYYAFSFSIVSERVECNFSLIFHLIYYVCSVTKSRSDCVKLEYGAQSGHLLADNGQNLKPSFKRIFGAFHNSTWIRWKWKCRVIPVVTFGGQCIPDSFPETPLVLLYFSCSPPAAEYALARELWFLQLTFSWWLGASWDCSWHHHWTT